MDAKRVLIGHSPPVLPQRFALRVFALLIAAFCISVVVYTVSFHGWYGGGGSDEDESYLQNWPTRHVAVVERCSEKFSKVCYSLTDVIDEESNTARRVLLTDGLAEFESMAPLIIPKGMSTKNSDTRLWEINHSTFICHYQMGMVGAAFAVGALQPPAPTVIGASASTAIVGASAPTKREEKSGDASKKSVDSSASLDPKKSSEKKEAAGRKAATAGDADDEAGEEEKIGCESAMIIGLGGGMLDMFLSGRFPKMNITVYEIDPTVVKLAHDWFGVRESARRRTVVGDGIEALRDASARNELYNVVFLDACNLDLKIPCPSSKFLQKTTLQHVKSILRPMGVFVVNVLPLQDECENLQKIYQQLTEHFPICTVTHFTAESNSIFACLPYDVPAEDLASLAAAWRKAWAKSVGALGFGDALKNVARFEVAPTAKKTHRFKRAKFGHAPAC